MATLAIKNLFRKYLDDDITPDEFSRLYEMISNEYDPASLDELLEGAFSNPAFAAGSGDHDPAAVFASLLARIEERKINNTLPAPVVRLRPWRRMAAASAIILFLVSGSIYLYRQKQNSSNQEVAEKKAIRLDTLQGTNGAILTLADGKQIVLDSSQNGSLEKQGNTRILKQGSQLSYKTDEGDQAVVLYNTITTPRGKQYQLLLTDGTKVWLNAASSIRFPATFNGKERRVEVSGEVYFEVAHNKDMPFIVQVDKTEIAVLGTHFNVTDYNDEKTICTTLLEGSVRIINGTQQALLVPGEQGRIERATGKLSSSQVDVEQIIAWTKGRLCLVNSDFPVLMRQISRWYDVDIVFQGAVPKVHIGGFIHRDVNLATVMGFLEETGVHYKVEGKTIIILP
ncbi:MAG TPA: FecR domain-containing protein [Puia sp.]|nr:FecR domain-containing protein [Puia sp.]